MAKPKKSVYDAKFIILFVLNIAFAVAIVMMAHRISVLTRVADEQFKTSIMFNARANNTRECLRHQDYECPDNKYFDSRKLFVA